MALHPTPYTHLPYSHGLLPLGTGVKLGWVRLGQVAFGPGQTVPGLTDPETQGEPPPDAALTAQRERAGWP